MPERPTSERSYLPGMDIIRIVGALSVFMYHYWNDVFATLPGVAFPGSRLAELLSYWPGPISVTAFILLAGVGMAHAWSRLKGDRSRFVSRRLHRLMAEYWWIATPMTALSLLAHRMPLADIWKVPIWFLGLGVLSPDTFFPTVSGWWYMSLAVQLVLIFPVLAWVLRRVGPTGLMLGSIVVSLTALHAVSLSSLNHLSYGLVFCRLPELSAGIVVGARMFDKLSLSRRQLGAIAAATVLYSLLGGVTTIMRGVVLVVVLSIVVLVPTDLFSGSRVWVKRLADLSFAFYLSHSPWARLIIPAVGRPDALGPWGACLVDLIVALAVAVAFHASFNRARLAFRPRAKVLGLPGVESGPEKSSETA